MLRYGRDVVSRAEIDRAARLLAERASSPARVILFGSHARGEADRWSDVDFLVIEAEVEDRFEEMVRLTRALGEIRVPAEVLVVSEEHVGEWGEVSGTMLSSALKEGRVVAQA